MHQPSKFIWSYTWRPPVSPFEGRKEGKMRDVAIANFALTTLIVAIGWFLSGWVFFSPEYFDLVAMEGSSFPSVVYFKFIFFVAVTATTLGGLTVNLAAILYSLAFPNANEWEVNYIIVIFVTLSISVATLNALMLPSIMFGLLSIFH